MSLKNLQDKLGKYITRIPSSFWYALSFIIFGILILILKGIRVPTHDQEILANFIEWFGILFSVLLALMIVQVWTKYSTVDALVDKEADTWVSLIRFTRFLNTPQLLEKLAQAITKHCQCFAQSRIANANKATYNESLEQIFLLIREALGLRSGTIIAKEMIKCFDEVLDTRGDRDAIVKERIPEVLWFMMVFTSMTWLLCFFWLSFQNVDPSVVLFMLFSTTFSVLGLLLIAKDIDNPVSGIWKISFKSFNEAIAEIKQIQQLAAKEYSATSAALPDVAEITIIPQGAELIKNAEGFLPTNTH